MKSIEDHIKKDKEILDNPQTNPAARRHIKDELHDLEEYVETLCGYNMENVIFFDENEYYIRGDIIIGRI